MKTAHAMASAEPSSDTAIIMGLSWVMVATTSTSLIMNGMRCLQQKKTQNSDRRPIKMNTKPITYSMAPALIDIPTAMQAIPSAMEKQGPNINDVHTTQPGAVFASYM